MAEISYRKGSWIGIVRSGAVIVLEADTSPAVVESLWDYLGQETPSVRGVLNAVTAQFGTALLNMPQFGIIINSNKLNVIVRGDMTLHAFTDGTELQVSGRDVSTWSERTLKLPQALTLTLEDVSEASTALPIDQSVVFLQEYSQGHRDQSAGAANQAQERPEASAVAQGPAQSDGAASLTGFAASDIAGTDIAEPEVSEDDDLEEDSAAFPTDVDVSGSESGDSGSQDSESIEEQDSADSEEQAEDQSDTDVFAGFAAASDAEWNAELADPNSADLPLDDDFFGNPDLESTVAGSSIFTPDEQADQLSTDAALDHDFGQTIYPSADAEDADSHEEDKQEHASAGSDEVDYLAGFAGDESADSAAENASSDADSFSANGSDAGTENDFQAADSSEALGSESAPVDANATDMTTNYDHLFGQTELHSVEDAAIRFDENGQIIPKDGDDPHAALPPHPSVPPLVGAQEIPAAFAAPQAPVEAAPEPWQPPSGLLIDSVPWNSQPTADVAAPSIPAHPDNGYEDSDHDGQTVMVNRKELPPEIVAAASLESKPPTGPLVLARLCNNGHANPPTRSVCASCGAAITAEAREVGRPRLGRMHISTGEVVDLDHSLIIGRQPSVSRVLGGVMPKLLQVQSSSGDISRSHVEVRLDGWDVMLVDLKATNGTVLVREGQPPRRLAQGEEALLVAGDIAELGDGISLLFEGLP